MLTLLINESNPLDGLFANSTTGGVGTVPDITVADAGQAVSVQSFTRAGGIITDSFVAGDALHIGIGDGVNAPVCYVALSSASPATGTMPINTAGMVALFAATAANQLSLTLAVVRTRGAYTNTIFSAPIVIRRSAINISTAVPTPSILGTGVAAALQIAINTALGFVRLDASARYPALDGSQITNLAGGSLTVGTSAITSGTTTRVLFDNAGVLGEYAISGTGSVAMTTSPSFTTPTIGDGTESAPSLSFTSDTNTGLYRPTADTVGIVGGGHDILRLTDVASATDYLEVKNGIGVGSPLHILAEGGSANIGMHLQPKGSGLLTISDGTDFNKGIRFRSSSSAASAITLLDAVSTAGRVVTLPDATGTLALVSGDLGTPSALVGTNITGTAASLTAGTVTTNANLTGHVTSVGNAAVLGSFTMAQLSAAVSDGDPAYVAFANTFTAANTFNQAATFTSGIHATKIQLGGTAGATIGIDIVPLNTPTQPIAGRSWMRVGGVSSESLMINAGLTGGYVDLCTDLGSGVRVWDGTGGHVAYLTAPATGTLRVTTNGSTLGTVDAATFTGNAATVTTNANMTGDVTSVGNATTLAAGSASALNSGTLDAARMANAGVHTGDATGTFPTITLNAAQTGITSVGTLTGGATGSGFTVALGTSTLTGRIGSANNTLANADTTSMTAVTTLGAAGVVTNMPGTTSASSATTGTLTIGNGTAATNVGIGGGNINAGGTIVAGGNISSQYITLASGRITINSGASTTSRLTNGSTSGWLIVDNQSGVGGAVLLGGGSGNPGIFRSGTTLQVRLADNSADAPISASNGTLSGTLSVTGATTLTGNLTSNGAYISTPQALSGNGAVAAVNLTTEVTTIANTGTANTTTTLAAGTNGQKKVISFITDGGFDAVITVTNPAWGGAGTITMNDALDNIELRYLNSVWQVFINNGCTLA